MIILQKKSIYLIGSSVYLFDNLIKINKTNTMFLRLFIFIFAINTLIPSAMALGGLASDSKMLMTGSEQITMSDSSDTNKTKMQMKMSCYSHTDCKMMDMDNCHHTQCSSGYLNNHIEYFTLLPTTVRQPHFVVTHFYHIVHPVHTPPPLV